MLPDPLHPALVHLPIALAVLAPFAAGLGVLAIRSGWLPARSWVAVVALQALVVGSGWLALETGEQQEERVERVVAERHIHDHQEAAERFLAVAAAAAVVSLAGLLAGRRGSVARVATLGIAVAALAAGIAVGHSGGQLVYRYGAASAYATPAAAAGPVAGSVPRAIPRDDD
jgi:uncharacterized membrane protein